MSVTFLVEVELDRMAEHIVARGELLDSLEEVRHLIISIELGGVLGFWG